MKKKRQEPVFNIELDHHLRQIVMKRGHLIRGQRTRTVFATISRGPKSWLEARLIPNPGDEAISNWTKAHELASKINAELRTDVYVEPASKHGRFNSIGTSDQSDTAPPMPEPSSFSTGASMGMGFGHGAVRTPFDFGASDMGLTGVRGYNVPDPMAQINAMLSPQTQQANSKGLLKCHALYDLPGWFDLPANKQKMFESEAAQLVHEGLSLGAEIPQLVAALSAIEMLKLQPTISRSLKQFLMRAPLPPSQHLLAVTASA